MGISLNIYRLYELRDSHVPYLLLKAVRPEFSNCDQTAELKARAEVDVQFESLISAARQELRFTDAVLTGTWEDGYPEGDVFYTVASGVDLDLWVSHYTNFAEYFVFGLATTEAKFWDDLQQSELWGFAELERPARRLRVRFVQ